MNAAHAQPELVNQLEKLITKAKGKITPGDLARETAKPINDIKDALARLLELYEAKVKMDVDTGGVLFDFDFPLKKKGKKTFKEQMQIFGVLAWEIFKKLYKALIGIVLIFYAVVFTIILLVILSRSNSNNRNSDGIGNAIGGLFRGIFQAFTFTTVHRNINYKTDAYGHRYRTYPEEKNKGKSFVQSVFTFVLGPERPKYNPLEDAKEAAAFIKNNNGKITLGHIIALSGVGYEEAERRIADYAVRFKGDLEISKSATVYAYFTEIMNNVSSDLKGGKIIFYPDEIESPYHITGNSTSRNIIIIFINIFNLVMSMVLLDVFSSHEIRLPWLNFALGVFPSVFSSLFFLIPLIRIPIVNRINSKREINIIRKDIFKSILENPHTNFTKSELFKYIEKENHHKADKILSKLVIELRGDISILQNGETIYKFEKLSEDLSFS